MLPFFLLIVTIKCSSAGTPAFSLNASAVIFSPLSRYRPSATFSRFIALSCTLFTVSLLTTAEGAVPLDVTDGFGDTSVRFFVVTATGFCVGTAAIFVSSVIVVTVPAIYMKLYTSAENTLIKLTFYPENALIKLYNYIEKCPIKLYNEMKSPDFIA